MTALAIWCNHETPGHPALWAAADSRITMLKRSPLIEDAVKIMSLPVIARAPGPGGFTEIYYTHTIGYGFAGSSLMGQNAYLALVPLLSNLISNTRRIPSLADIARYIETFLNRVFEYPKVRGEFACFEVALFGYCPCRNALAIYHFEPIGTPDGAVMRMTAHENLKDRDFIYLGTDRGSMEEAIRTAFAGPNMPGRPTSRAPRYVINDRISDHSCQAIGGDLQLARADRWGCRPEALAKPRVEGRPEAYLSYLGYELDEDMLRVGEVRVGLNGAV
ncbi:MAG: hypothetical protein M0Z85_02350 [Gammaproteobacteria bacterium]|nr:hypothetical protein [Gammaproteobacteria bacterium]